MSNDWRPSPWGKLFTRSADWSIRMEGERVEVVIGGQPYQAVLKSEHQLQVTPGLLWSMVEIQAEGGLQVVGDGLPNEQGHHLRSAIATRVAERRRRERLAMFEATITLICDWLAKAKDLVEEGSNSRRWITHEQQQAVLLARPELAFTREELQVLALDDDLHEDLGSCEHQRALGQLRDWDQDWVSLWEEANESMTRRELVLAKDFMDRVESDPLTEEQARAVICFDNRVQVVASAGSGKTSTMVAKAAYAVERGFLAPERIVMLAFNDGAAKELRERADKALDRLGMNGVEIQACTFHSLGLSIIRGASGRKLQVPEWARHKEKGIEKLGELIDQLKDRSTHFRTQWDMFRLVFGKDLPCSAADSMADGFDANGRPYLNTLSGSRVQNMEERVIADWLFYNGVDFEYKRSYEFDSVRDIHRQNQPNFYYPDADAYHEHAALPVGATPSQQARDADDLAWRREHHACRGRAFIETTSVELRSGQAFRRLAEQLPGLGIEVDPNPDRPLPERAEEPMSEDDLISLLRTFIAHAKSNVLSLDDISERLRGLPEDHYKERLRRFLELATPVYQAWDDALGAEQGIDFEDMLNTASLFVEQGRYTSPYDLVMADEFQDSSRARARLCAALVSAPGKHLYAVGDDWQAINRFAGADLSVMTDFCGWNGHGKVLRLEETFRFPQELCDVSGRFVMRNPSQIRKNVRSSKPPAGAVLQAFQVNNRKQVQDGVRQYLAQLQEKILSGVLPRGQDGRVSVLVLGRYNFESDKVPSDWEKDFGQTMSVEFMSIHRSKGKSADYVILPGMIRRSFPSAKQDDSVLSLVMPQGDTYPDSEERRLFYVALTRARRTVVMFTVQGKVSPFLGELLQERAVELTTLGGQPINEEQCPVCKVGVFVDRMGRNGAFRSCSSYPDCENKPRKRR
ncbi:UvrD-helicase domain-containing protein [uncultured Stenotrophomonas sp.]|uniref:UvrD-helicase domain-containing protein n=1 Tax=uncultured Stenotrophomonas sp. TaxID=165438 RepID=UPI0025FC73AD|nr:UvrD-helicase domain-containing protein [uncultured Stenotrophomonas sp.]